MRRRFDFSKHKHLKKDWSPSNGADFEDDSVRAMENYQWLCANGHSAYRATLANRAYHNSGCPICGVLCRNNLLRAQIRRPKAGQSIAERYPALVAYFHADRNTLSPDRRGVGCEIPLWWRCEKGHQWNIPVGPMIRALGRGSRGCMGCYLANKRRPKPGQSLGDRHPELVGIWHPTKNGDLTPFDVRPNCNDYADWLCGRGHETRAIINSRSSGFACVHCRPFNKSKVEGDFRTLFGQSLVLTEVLTTAHRMAIDWTNLQNRQWMTVDICGEVRRHPHLKVVIEYDGKYFHDRPEVSARELPKTLALLDAGYLVVRIRENGLARIDLTHPRLFQVNHNYRFKDPIEALLPTMKLVEDWLLQPAFDTMARVSDRPSLGRR